MTGKAQVHAVTSLSSLSLSFLSNIGVLTLSKRFLDLISPVVTYYSPPSSCRDEFNLKLALLSNQWQGVVRRAQQRRGIIDGLIRQWQRYREMVEKLRKWLVEVSHPAEPLQAGTTVPLQQARSMLDAVQVHNVKAHWVQIIDISTVAGAGQKHPLISTELAFLPCID